AAAAPARARASPPLLADGGPGPRVAAVRLPAAAPSPWRSRNGWASPPGRSVRHRWPSPVPAAFGRFPAPPSPPADATPTPAAAPAASPRLQAAAFPRAVPSCASAPRIAGSFDQRLQLPHRFLEIDALVR